MVENNRRTKLLLKIILGQAFFALIVCAIAFGSIGYAEGYRIDWGYKKITKTGVLTIKYLPSDANLLISGKKLCKKRNPCSINLKPGQYHLEISKEGYLGWNFSLVVLSRLVTVLDNVVMFKQNITSATLSDQSKIQQINASTDSLAYGGQDRLFYTDYEIWVGQSLVTRLSSKISRAIWYPDQDHIIYQQGNEIRIIEKDGRNDTLLVTLSSSTSTNFVVNNKGDELYFFDSSEYKTAKIR